MSPIRQSASLPFTRFLPVPAFLVLAAAGPGCARTSEILAPPFAHAARPVIIAHRGGALEAPENTLAALRHGVAVGADWQEIDVQLSSDETPVLMHDDTLDRTTDGVGPAGALQAADLQRLSAGRPELPESVAGRLAALGLDAPDFGDRFAGEKVPTLAQALAVDGVRLMIEVKADPRAALLAERVLEEVERAGAGQRVAIGSFDAEILREAWKRDPSIDLIGIADTEEEAAAMLSLPLRVLAVGKSVVPFALYTAPPEVAVWVYTAYAPEEAAVLATRGVHGIITDVPAAVVRALPSME